MFDQKRYSKGDSNQLWIIAVSFPPKLSKYTYYKNRILYYTLSNAIKFVQLHPIDRLQKLHLKIIVFSELHFYNLYLEK